MGITQSTAALLRLLAIVLVVAAVYLFGDQAVKFVRAPVQTQLDASRGNNKAMKAGADAQNRGVDAMKADTDQRQARGRAAVQAAGKAEEKRAQDILEAKPVGETDYERAVNRIDRELGLQ